MQLYPAAQTDTSKIYHLFFNGLTASAFTSFRRTYATRAAQNGLPIELLARQMGHQRAWLTEHYYVHQVDDPVADEVRRFLPPLLGNAD